jgi:hypothetical protein
MPEEPTTPDLEELEAHFRTAFSDGTDIAHLARDDAAFAAFSQAFAPILRLTAMLES